MPILFFDTETTGFCDFKAPSSDPDQPHLVQLAATLDDDEGNTLQTIDKIILPYPGYTHIPEAASALHKITIARAENEGELLVKCLKAFHKLWIHSTLTVCHNTPFDLKILKIAYFRAGISKHFFEDINSFCTMKATTQICKLPKPSGARGYKWPKLEEAYRILINPDGFEDAHNALADVKACREIFYYLKENNIGGVPIR